MIGKLKGPDLLRLQPNLLNFLYNLQNLKGGSPNQLNDNIY